MKIATHLLCAALFLSCFAGFSQNNPVPANSTDSQLVTVSGTVEVAKAGTTTWTAGQAGQVLRVGDRVKTGKNSRATVRLTNQSVLRVYELTTLEIQPPAQTAQNPTLDLKSGAVYFFNRDKPQTTQFRTPSASGAIRGTEFNLAVAEDGRMLLTLVDGDVNLQNELGSLELKTGEQAMVEPGKAPVKTPSVDAINVIQWTLYYPGVLDVDELGLADDLKVNLAPSLDAYRAGDLLKAVDSYPWDRESASPEDKVYRAALSLAAGKVDQAQNLLQNLGEGKAPQIGEALKTLIAAVKHQEAPHSGQHSLATEYMASSYYHQSRGDLSSALADAKAAAAKSPNFGYAHERVAELEFGFGHTEAAMAALEKSLSISPRNAQAIALKGFLLAAQNKIKDAGAAFDKAIETDGNLGNAWLGRGLVKIKRGQVDEGRKDLETAAGLEPNRAVLRSYLGKAWSMGRPWMYSWDQTLATKELNLARELDPNDPTSWLYMALLNQQRNQVNDAVENLERSKELNDNRRIFRSKMLLDQDRAVRSANLASVYRDAGMIDYSVREAARAVDSDPGNFSAHLFLSETYDSLRDPRALSLRFETPWLSELLLANLLQPVGAGNLSQNVSQQEYSKLFESDKFGVSSFTEYMSSGDWWEKGSQYGTFGNSSYALDVEYRSINGQRINNDSEVLYTSAKFKQQIAPHDSVLFQITRQDADSGDILQYYFQGNANPTLRVKELQEPKDIVLGYHHEWSPGNHTLFLFDRGEDTLDIEAPSLSKAASVLTINNNGTLSSFAGLNAQQTNRSETKFYSAELQQILQISSHSLIAGGRFQTGDTENSVRLKSTGLLKGFVTYNSGPIETDFHRYSLYVYDRWQILDQLQLTAGVSYDYVHYPVNTDLAPLSAVETHKDQISPKAAIRYTPLDNTTLRAAYSQWLGGLFSEESVRLEPTQIGGFTQLYRSITPESLVGSVPGTRFTEYGVGVEQKFKSKTYITADAQILESDASRAFGIFTFTKPPPGVPAAAVTVPSSTPESIKYRERSLTLSVNQLIGDDFAVGLRYRISKADLQDTFTALPTTLKGVPSRSRKGVINEADLFAIYNHRCGFFARTDATWVSQSNTGVGAPPGDDFWQFHVFAGYRFPRRQAEIRVGIVNIFDHDYQLDPINYYLEYPRERTFVASFKFNF